MDGNANLPNDQERSMLRDAIRTLLEQHWPSDKAKAFAAEPVRERYLALGASLPLGSPDEFALHIAAERQKWGEVIRQANIRLE